MYLAALAVVASTAAVMATIRWEHNRHLLAVAAALAVTGWMVRRRRPRRWLAWHGTAMAGSYIALLTGFYVDNGPQLPVWDRLPPLAFWFLPATVGLPVTWWALRRDHAVGRPRRAGRPSRADGR